MDRDHEFLGTVCTGVMLGMCGLMFTATGFWLLKQGMRYVENPCLYYGLAGVTLTVSGIASLGLRRL